MFDTYQWGPHLFKSWPRERQNSATYANKSNMGEKCVKRKSVKGC